MAIFEKHNMSDPRLPFIFHVTDLKRKRPGVGNWHENIEILYVERGRGFVIVDDERISVKADELVCIGANKLHGTYTDTDEMIYACLIIDRGFFLENHFDSSLFLFKSHIADDRLSSLIGSFKRYWTSSVQDEPMRIQHLRSLALDITIILCEEYALVEKEAHVDSPILSAVKKAVSYIRNNITSKITLESLSAFSGISKYYLARHFKRITGLSVVEYINAARCERAKSLLISGAKSISEIALSSGFENLSYFTRTFKRHYGLTPTEYRKTEAF